MITIAQLATEYGSQPYEIASALDLGTVHDDHEVDETFAREVLDILSAQTAEMVDDE